MAEEGDVLAESNALVDVEEELTNRRNITAAPTQTVLQRIDGIPSAQSGASGQVVGCRESSASDGAPGTPEAEHRRRRMDATHGWTGGAQGPSQPTRTSGAQDPIPTEQRMDRSAAPNGSSD